LYEHAYFGYFAEWYLELGVGCIITLQTDGWFPLEYESDKIIVYQVPNYKNHLLATYEYLAIAQQPAYQWILSLDVDEFLVLQPPFISIDHYIGHLYSSIAAGQSKRLDAVLFYWMFLDNLSPHVPPNRCATY